MDSPTVIVIARPEHMAAMRKRLGANLPAVAFSAAESLQVLATIRPALLESWHSI